MSASATLGDFACLTINVCGAGEFNHLLMLPESQWEAIEAAWVKKS
jgi:hypothetical protein